MFRSWISRLQYSNLYVQRRIGIIFGGSIVIYNELWLGAIIRWIAAKGELDYSSIIQRRIIPERYCGSIRRDCAVIRIITIIRSTRVTTQNSVHRLIIQVCYIRTAEDNRGSICCWNRTVLLQIVKWLFIAIVNRENFMFSSESFNRVMLYISQCGAFRFSI